MVVGGQEDLKIVIIFSAKWNTKSKEEWGIRYTVTRTIGNKICIQVTTVANSIASFFPCCTTAALFSEISTMKL